MAVPKEREVGKEVLPTPLLPASIWPRRRFHFAILSTFSMQWRFSFESLQLKLQFACINQLCLADAALCICGVSLSAQGEEREQAGGISSSSILSSTSTPFRQHLFLSLASNEYAAYSIIVRPAFISFQRDD